MSDTPRMDSQIEMRRESGTPLLIEMVPADFARQLKRELDHMTEWKDSLVEIGDAIIAKATALEQQRDQWREVAEGLHKIVEEYWEPDWESAPMNKRNVLDLYDKLKEQQ